MSRTILLADDSLTIQKVVELTFADTQYSVVALSSGEQLLQQLPVVRPDLIICDIIMPGKDGYQVCQEIKSDPDTLHIPVVLLSGTFEPFDRDRALAAGCSEIITKPFEARKLVETVDRLLSAPQEAAAQLGEAAAASPADTIYIPQGAEYVPPVISSPPMTAAADPIGDAASDDSGLDFTDSGFADMEAAATAHEPSTEPPEEGLEFEFEDEEHAFSAAAAEPTPEGIDEEPAPAVEEPQLSTREEEATATNPELDLAAPAPAAPQPTEEPFPDTAHDADDLPRPKFDRADPFLDTDAAMQSLAEGSLQAADENPEDAHAGAVEDEEVPPPLSALPPTAEGPTAPLATWADPTQASDQDTGEETTEQDVASAETVTDREETDPAHRGEEATPPPPGPEEGATEAVAARLDGETPSSAPMSSLSDEDVERVARRILELAADRIESVVWEVVPDMAEIVVRERLRQLEAEAERASSDSVQ